MLRQAVLRQFDIETLSERPHEEILGISSILKVQSMSGYLH